MEVMSYAQAETQQRELCKNYKVDFVTSRPESKLGISLETIMLVPINGLRHRPEGDTNGWYIWGGEQLLTAADFFQPLHTEHLAHRLPTVLRFLGLPPGYRFLVAGDYVDIWFDKKLLEI